jgi:hypothetical protein
MDWFILAIAAVSSFTHNLPDFIFRNGYWCSGGSVLSRALGAKKKEKAKPLLPIKS